VAGERQPAARLDRGIQEEEEETAREGRSIQEPSEMPRAAMGQKKPTAASPAAVAATPSRPTAMAPAPAQVRLSGAAEEPRTMKAALPAGPPPRLPREPAMPRPVAVPPAETSVERALVQSRERPLLTAPVRRPRLAPAERTAAAATAEPAIQVTIGRIEVRAAAEQGPRRKERADSPVMSLDEYLKQRAAGGKP
jgi:hypothetical protein